MVRSAEPVLPDLGVVGSVDPVAVDTAAMDRPDGRHGRDVFGQFWHRTQLEYGQQIGLGSTRYEMVHVE
jgi:uncharacterized Fe-S center protein